MSLLKAEPSAPVQSLDELFALAHTLEVEAATRYAELADEMERLELPEVAAVFQQLVAEECGHAAHVENWARDTTGTPLDPTSIRWQPPETFDEEEARQIARLASAYRALSMAVRIEERAFALWTYIAAQAKAPAIRAAAERMAGEELHHAALLRRARRHAYHAERDSSATGHPPALVRATQAEARLAALLPALAAGSAASGPHSAELWRLGEAAAAMGGEAAALTGDAWVAAPPGVAGREGLQEALRLSEQAAESYLDAAEAGRDEERVRRLHALAEDAIARVAVLRHVAGPA
jgi:rubrerythrin